MPDVPVLSFEADAVMAPIVPNPHTADKARRRGPAGLSGYWRYRSAKRWIADSSP